MKHIFTIFIFSLLAFSLKAQWVEFDTGMENPPVFNDVYAITPDIVVVVGANGTILKTTDGGETWIQKTSGTTENLRKVRFPTSDIGYIASEGSVFLKTTDGGETWFPIDTGNDCFFYSFSSIDENLIFATCSGFLLKSDDGGGTWNEIAPITGGGEILFLNNEIGFAWEDSGSSLSKTTNGGETWENLEVASPAHFFNENIGYFYDSGLYKTTDGGNNFDLVCSGDWWAFTDIFAPDENNVWGILVGLLDGDGSTRGIAKISSQDGETFTEVIELENNVQLFMNSIYFANETTGYIAGFKNGKGAIWKNGTGINELNTTEVNANIKFNVYPNPATNELNILFDKSINADITLTDITGKQVYSKTLHKNKTTINTQGFSKGTYILSVKTGNKTFTKKIIIH